MADKTLILITGANQGLGYYAAQQLAADGKYHVLVGSRDVGKAEKAIKALVEDSSMKVDAKNLEALQIDVTDDNSIQAAAQTVEKKYGKLDILLNNAGVAFAQEGDVSALRELYRKHYDVNVFGAAVTTEAFLPLLRKGSAKRLAFTSSGLSSLSWACTSEGMPGMYPLYRSTKTALNMIVIHYAKILEAEGFIVSANDPGYCGTNLNSNTGPKDPRDGAKVLIRSINGAKEDIHCAVVDETSKEPW